jgi:hypothetical protein
MRPPARLTALALSLALGASLLAGCGSANSSTSTATSGQSAAVSAAARAAAKSTAEAVRAAEAKAPKGASPVLRQIYRQFPKPKPNPTVKGSAKALAAGEAACKDKSPLEVKEEFYAAAKANLQPEEAKMIARLPSFAKKTATDPSFVAGQLAADAYQATLPEALAQFGYQGCVYALALRLKGELGPKQR